ncbi:hypothetical protein MAPG_04627 [Magnaporthiopsis poae ATCC 64411]|uniref:Uncharacterized protein n=1 Tax=Magnaporthiopsis poae (strain ATCC 64411 / 73-15) TaxID=644358 RepID=A0A0C4DX87_MAGP6|nr:hypothetical protein MAPG_04627 [Magnaporthiopsis poae ATCC 64411]
MSPCLCCVRPKVVPDADDLPKVRPPPGAVGPRIQPVDQTRQLGTRESLGRLQSLLGDIADADTPYADSTTAEVAGPTSFPGPELTLPMSPHTPASSDSSRSSVSVPFLNIFEEASHYLGKLQQSSDQFPGLEAIVAETSKKLEALHKAHEDVEALHGIQSSLLKVHNSMQALQPSIYEATAKKKKSKDPLQAALDKVLKNVAKELEKARTATDQALAATNTATRDSLRVSIVQMTNALEGRSSGLQDPTDPPAFPSSRRASELAKTLSGPSSRRATELVLDPLLASVAEEPAPRADIALEASELEHDAEMTKSRLESTAKELLTDFMAEARQSLSEAQGDDVVNADPVIEATLAEDPAAEGPVEDPAEDPVEATDAPVADPAEAGDEPQVGDDHALPPTEDDGATTDQPRLSVDPGSN